jgi:hypothetical protein
MPTPPRKNNLPDFVIRIVGLGISPRGVPMRSLTRVLNAVQRLIERTEDGEIDFVEGGESETQSHLAMPLHLVKVTKGSAAYSVVSDMPSALDTISETGRWLRDPSHSDWEPEILSPIEDLSAVSKALSCEIEFTRPGKNPEVLARITPKSYDELAQHAFVKGDGSVSGTLERVGGATKMHCGLRLAEQPTKMIICPVATESLVRDLGQHVYKPIRVSGTVTWFRKTWRVKSVLVKSFDPTKEGSILQALDRIYEAGGKDWDNVEDVDGLLSEIRGK